ncbi:MAG: hypothetical protein AAFV86_11940 [Pseudomonadota bacterium]
MDSIVQAVKGSLLYMGGRIGLRFEDLVMRWRRLRTWTGERENLFLALASLSVILTALQIVLQVA